MPDADLSLAIPAVGFGAIGTAGQRCTSTRRLYLHRSIANEFLERLQKLYGSIKPGDPLEEKTLLGPLHTRSACETYSNAITHLKAIGSDILVGGKNYDHAPFSAGNFVEPTISLPKSVNISDSIWTTEVFAPILNVGIFDELEQAIEWNNAVPQVWCDFRIGPVSFTSLCYRDSQAACGPVISETSVNGLVLAAPTRALST